MLLHRVFWQVFFSSGGLVVWRLVKVKRISFLKVLSTLITREVFLSAVRLCLFSLKLIFIPFAWIFVAAYSVADPQSLEALTGQWLALEKQKGSIQQQWGERKSYLQQRIELLEIEQKSLQNVKQSANLSIEKIDKERNDLLESQLRLERESELLTRSVALALSNINKTSLRFPPPLTEQWHSKIDANTTNKNLSESLEFILSLLKSVGEFNQRIVLHRGPVSLTDEQAKDKIVMVNQIYMGVAHGWYVSDDHKHYGYGNSVGGQWHWWHGEQAAAKLKVSFDPSMVADVVKILQEPTHAKYVPLPISISGASEGRQ